MGSVVNEQKACKGMVRRTAEETLQLTQWMKNIVGNCFHCVVGSLYIVNQTGGRESGNVHHDLVEKMEQLEI